MIHKVSNALNKAASGIVMTLLALLFLNVFVTVVLRTFTQINFMGSYDYSRILFIWCTFIGASVAYKEKGHSAFAFIYEKTKGPLRHGLDFLQHTLILLFLAILLYFGAKLTLAVKVQNLPASGASAIWLYLPVAVSTALMLVHCIGFISETFQGGKKDENLKEKSTQEASL